MRRTLLKSALAAAVVAAPLAVFTANHREAPITALDRAADITDWYSFVSYDDPSQVTMILSVDPLLEPANGPNYFPFDPEILYEMKVDNDQDARRGRDVPVPLPDRAARTRRVHRRSSAGSLGIPPITALDGPGSEGLGLRQTYTVTVIRGGQTLRPDGGRSALRRADQRRPAHDAQLPGALRPGHLRPRQRHPRLRRHHRRPLLHRPRRRLRLAQLPRPRPAAAC